MGVAKGLLGLEVDDLGVDELDLLRPVEEGDVVAQAADVQVGVRAVPHHRLVGRPGLVAGDLVADVGHPGALVGQGDAQPLVEEGHLLETAAQRLVVEVDGLEDGGVGVEGLGGAGGGGLLAPDQGSGRLPAVAEAHAPHVPLAAHLGVDAGGQGVDHGDADAVKAAGDGVAAAAELAAGVEDGHDDLDGGPVLGGVLVHGDAASVVDDPESAVGLDGDLDVVAVAGQGLVDGVVHDLVHQVVQPALAGGADVHAGPLAHSLEPLEDGDVGGTVVGRSLADVGLGGGHRLVLVRHVSAAPLSVHRAAPIPLNANWRARSRGV